MHLLHVGAIFLVLAALIGLGCDSSSSPTPTQTVDNAQQTSISDSIIERLRTAGWTAPAAQAVAELNRDYFSILSEYPERLDDVLHRLERLGRYDALATMPRIAQHPELAALYASNPFPMELDRAFVNEDCVGVYAGMFQLITDPAEQQTLADAFQRHGATICALGQHGIPAPATLFMFNHDRSGAKEYARWLEDALQQALRASPVDESLADVTALALNQGEQLRQRMASDDEFRQAFRARLWPALMRLTDCSRKLDGDCDTPFELLADEPRIWDLLMLDQGERLLDRGGLLAVELLVDDPDGASFPSELRPLAQEALLEGDNSTLGALLRFQDQPLFRHLMLREDLNSNLRQRILADLAQLCPEDAAQCPGLERRLRDLGTFSFATLNEDLAPPPDGPQTWIPLYSTYYMAKKLAQGREVNASDLAFAALDVVSFVPGVGAGGKVVSQTLKSGSKTLSKQVATKIAADMAKKSLKKDGTDWVEKLAIKGRLMTAVTKQYLQPLIVKTQRIDQAIEQIMRIDVTKPIQWMFTKTGSGRASMKKWTGLEARIFMRKDGRVIMQTKSIIKDQLSENLVEEGAEFALQVWQEHASIWWFENATLTP